MCGGVPPVTGCRGLLSVSLAFGQILVNQTVGFENAAVLQKGEDLGRQAVLIEPIVPGVDREDLEVGPVGLVSCVP